MSIISDKFDQLRYSDKHRGPNSRKEVSANVEMNILLIHCYATVLMRCLM